MIQTVVVLVLFTLGGLWYTSRAPHETPGPGAPLLTRKTYGLLLAGALLLGLLWR